MWHLAYPPQPVISELLAKVETYLWQTNRSNNCSMTWSHFLERDAADIAPYQVKTGSYIGAIIKHHVKTHLFHAHRHHGSMVSDIYQSVVNWAVNFFFNLMAKFITIKRVTANAHQDNDLSFKNSIFEHVFIGCLVVVDCWFLPYRVNQFVRYY